MRFAPLLLLVVLLAAPLHAAEPLKVGVFDVDASPPIGSPLAYDPTQEVQTPLSCRGIVLLGSEEPIVLCAVDWLGIGNGSHVAFRKALAEAAGTSPDRVAVHALHQHDAPWSDFSSDELIEEHGVSYRPFDSAFVREVIARAAKGVAEAKDKAKPATHVAFSSAKVDRVASNRRIQGPDGRVTHIRWSATKDPAVREFPEGVIDPLLRMVAFYHDDQPIAALTYYATHPQSYYRTGKANPDFPGLARNSRQEATGVPHIHFNGAAGNITAGKYNDGSPENRQVLADRMADAMQQAWEAKKPQPITADNVSWKAVSVTLPPREELAEASLLDVVKNGELNAMQRFVAATKLAWLRRADEPIVLGCLRIGDAALLHMPGELFIEYQLEAQQLAPERFIALAAYGDYGTAYIGTAVSYDQGGYETGSNASYVSPKAEAILMQGIGELLGVPAERVRPLR
jgi:hypothetical protein